MEKVTYYLCQLSFDARLLSVSLQTLQKTTPVHELLPGGVAARRCNEQGTRMPWHAESGAMSIAEHRSIMDL